MQNPTLRSPSPSDTNTIVPPVPDFAPVPRRGNRHDGWTAARQRDFILALGQLGSVTLAARAVGLAHASAYALRHAPGAGQFSAAWDVALGQGVARVYDVLVDHAVHGAPDPIMFGGAQVGERRRYNYRMMMWLLQHHRPDRFPGGGGLGGYARSKARLALEAQDNERIEQAQAKEARSAVMTMLATIRSGFKRRIADDPARRAAWELLVGPTDWDNPDAVDCEPGASPVNMNRADMIVAIAAEEAGD